MVSHGMYTRVNIIRDYVQLYCIYQTEDVPQMVVRIIKDEKVVLVRLNGYTRLGHHTHREI